MTAVLPQPVPLEPPPGDPRRLDDLVRQVGGAASRLGALAASLAGSSATAPAWSGDDATAAAARLGVATTLAHDASVALGAAAGRLAGHLDRVHEAGDRIRALVGEQDEALARARARLAALEDPARVLLAGAPEAVAVVEDFAAGEARRRALHAGLLAAVVDDAVATERLLAECSTVVGGRGGPEDRSRSLGHLALVLPHWGEVELAARGRELATRLGSLTDLPEREALARAAAGHVHVPAFADALLTGLGPAGVRGLLTDLGGGGLPEGSALAALVASAFGAARRSGRRGDPVAGVLDAGYLDPRERSSHEDVVALGMAAVISAGARGRSAGPDPRTVLSWGHQLLAREQVRSGHPLGGRAVDRAGVPPDRDGPGDPVAVVAESLARAHDAGVAAAFLERRRSWDVLLSRPWDDDAAGLALLVERATGAGGPAGELAVRTGLEALGAGLAADDPADWTVDRGTAAAVAPALGAGLAVHVGVAVDALRSGIDGRADPLATDAVRGLGLVTLERPARAVVAEALSGWAAAEAQRGPALDPAGLMPAVAVPAAYLAAHQWAVSMDHTLDGLAAQADARRRALGWRLLVGWVGFLPGTAGDLAGVVEGYAAILLDMDGTWDDLPDPGTVVDPATDLARSPAASSADVAEVRRQAWIAFDRTTALLGDPAPPASPPADLLAPLQDAGLSQVGDLVRTPRRGWEPGNDSQPTG